MPTTVVQRLSMARLGQGGNPGRGRVPRSAENAGAVPFRELDDGAIGIADVELPADEDALLAVFLLENLHSPGGEEGLRFLILRGIDLERMVRPPGVVGAALQWPVAPREDYVIVTRAQEHH